MNVFKSSPGMHRAGWRVWATAAALIWMIPCALGIAVLGLAYGAGIVLPEGHALLATLYILGFVLFFSPILSWLGLIIALPLAALLMARGWAGRGSFAALGLATGLIAGAMVGDGYLLLGPVFGLLAALGFRAVFFALARGS
jgi:hypothetical protein